MQIFTRFTVLFLVSLLLAGVVFVCSVASSVTKKSAINFSAHELAWMKAHPVIRVAPDPDFPPVEFIDQNGSYKGIAADFIKLLEQRLPLKFEIIHLKNWDQVLKQGKTREIDMFAAAVPTPERLQYMKFTDSYVDFPAVILVRSEQEISPRVNALDGKHVAVVSGYAAYEYMKRVYPNVYLEVMPDISSGLRQVSFGKVDAMILNLASASFYLRKDGISNLKVYRDTDFIYDLSFASRSDWPELHSILDKTLASISDEERNKIISTWITLTKDGWHTSRNFLISLCVISVGLALLFVAAWILLLKRQVAERTAALERELAEHTRAEEEKKQLQQEVNRAKKMEALGLLAGGVAHDLNNILTGIVGYPDLILPRLDPGSSMYRQVEAMQRSGKQAVAVVADLLTITRGTASVKEPIDMNQAVMDYLHSPEHKKLAVQYPEISLHTELGTGLPCLLGSEVHIRKTIMNLVLNGFEAMREQKGTLSIRTRVRDFAEEQTGGLDMPAGQYVILEICDSGEGIAEEDLERIFEPFYSKKKMARSGTGLGLAVVSNTVRDHDGSIQVQSDEQGTCFTLYFPAVQETVAQVRDMPTVEDLQGRGECILIVDDEQQVRELAVDMLKKLQYAPVAVASGEEALAWLAEHRADLVILDMIMDPGMDGLAAYSGIVQLYPGQKAVIASGYAENDKVRKGLALGAGEYIRKPYSIETLGQVLRKVLAAD